jgi:formate dehydrogenase subunit gamma
MNDANIPGTSGPGALRPGTSDPQRRALIVRYTAKERINHWIVAMAFVVAGLSGLALFHPALFWLTNFFGGGPWTRILHPLVGLLMVVAFVFYGAGKARENKMEPRDWQWLRQIQDVISNREERLPEVGRYNAGQKLVFYSVVLCLTGLLVTGIVIWRAYFSQYFPITVIRWGALIHALCAFALICTILTHIYAAIWIKGSIRAMTRGTVTPGWAWKHHRAWFRELIKHNAASSRPRPD